MPNKENNMVYLRDLLEAESFKNHKSRLCLLYTSREKQNLTVEDLLAKFAEASGGQFANDRMLLSK